MLSTKYHTNIDVKGVSKFMKNDVLREKIEECLKTLGARDLTKVHKFLTELMLTTDAPMKANLACPWCGSTQVIKYGLKNMRQRYRCQHESCKRTFVSSTNTVMYHSRFDKDTWMEFLKDTLEGRALDYSAERLGFSHQTAFVMRHKVLSALEDVLKLDPTTLREIVELDETYVLDNYKGAPVPEEAGRAPRKRGGKASSRGISKEQVCICTGVQRNGPAIAMTVNRATPSKDELKQVFSSCIGPGSLILTDGARGYQVLRAAVEGCSVVNVRKQQGGIYHLNTVNSFHSCIKRLNSTFRGVATKYINRYNGLFSLIYRKGEEIRDALSSCIRKASTVCYWTPISALKLRGVLNL